MADKVQLCLENSINELDQLVKQGLFTKSEIRNILKKRRAYEYSFEKKDVSKLDFFKAVRYEKILDKKRKIRKKEKKVKQTSYFEFTFIRRAVFLFQKMLRKFKNSEDIWIEFFHFLNRNQCYNVMNREIGRCLSLFPKNLEFWKIAAYNEHENNCNSLTARTLFQKCIRMNKDNMEAYLEYFIFELKFVEKLVLRDKILKGDDQKLKFIDDIEEIKKQDENINTFNKIELTDEVLGLQIPEIIWRNALEVFKDRETRSLSLKFLENLYKYGKVVNIKPFTRKIKDYLISEALTVNIFCQTKIDLIKISLKKYSKNELFNKTQSKLIKLMDKEINDNSNLHFIISNLIKLFTENCLSEFDEEEAITLKFLVFQYFIKFIRKDEFIDNPQSIQNIEIFQFLIENFSNFKKNLLDYKLNLMEILENIIINQITIKIIDINYLKLYSNLLQKENISRLAIFYKMIVFFDKKSLKSEQILALIHFFLELINDDHNTNDVFLFKEFNKLLEIYQGSANKTISSNKLFVELLCENFIKKIYNIKELNSASQINLDFIQKISQDYLINYREIFRKLIVNKNTILPTEFLNKIK